MERRLYMPPTLTPQPMWEPPACWDQFDPEQLPLSVTVEKLEAGGAAWICVCGCRLYLSARSAGNISLGVTRGDVEAFCRQHAGCRG